ncbi:SDR family NAD(P)-dependent oxidoreductase [Sphingobacterium sp. LRF_L2]|uniref:SDR family NAD(P)-dependent oxidoreductase n=1 Tax=Sphingobacterium sp. LRF_L2 TaxID=3369421 RepID=UPI003F6104D6
MKNENLKKYALITGGTSGIGRELVTLFAQDGYHIVIVARTEEGLATVKDELERKYHVEVITIAKDLSLANAGFELYQEIRDKNIFIDVLVNDAGQGQYGLFTKTDINRVLEIIQLNIISLTTLTYLFLKDMLAHDKGRILQLGSIASEMPGPWQAVYHATKSYVLSFSEGVAQEIKGSQVTITVLEPGATDTDFFNKAGMQDSKIMDSKLGKASEVAKDGYEGLMQGKSKVISGFKNKVIVTASNVLPDVLVAERMGRMQEPKKR